MDTFDAYYEDDLRNDLNFLQEQSKPFAAFTESTNSYFEKLHASIALFRNNGFKFTAAVNYASAPGRESFKENKDPRENEEETVREDARPKRKAFSKASQMINQQSSFNLNSKLRRPSGENITGTRNAYVKLEKVSTSGSEKSTISAASNTDTENEKIPPAVNVKEEMPAPKKPPPRKKKQTKSMAQVKIKQEMIDEEEDRTARRDSDVVINEEPVPVVELSDDEPEPPVETRSTRTKTIRKNKRARDESEEAKAQTKRSKSHSDHSDANSTARTQYADARSTLEEDEKRPNINDATFVTTTKPPEPIVTLPPPLMNSTVIVDKPKYNHLSQVAEELLTDDEDEDQVMPVKKKLNTKPVFSSFDPSPVKRKVAAFEKLGAQAATEVRVTRTKTRALAKVVQDPKPQEEEPVRNVVKEKAKLFTPSAHSKLPLKTGATTSKIIRALPNSSSDSCGTLPVKPMTALKASQAEYRERERLRKERENEALRKREALRQAQIEEKKRKREEKQQKAQQQREILEKEKLKALEAQKVKEERHKLMMAEQEEKKTRLKEEVERRRLLAKKKALDERKKEEERRLEGKREEEELNANVARHEEQIRKMAHKHKAATQQQPVYLTQQAPLLPTEDCYDTDDEENYKRKIKHPIWTKGNYAKEMQLAISAAGEKVKNTFFSRQADTPDLQKIFEVIHPRYLKRNSSAIWHKAPKYSILPTLALHAEYSEDDD